MKTKVLLTFGQWGSGAKRDITETDFFRRSVCPFVEREVEAGKRVFVIAEQKLTSALLRDDSPLASHMNLFLDLVAATGAFPSDGILQSFFDIGVRSEMARITQGYDTTLNMGVMNQYNEYGFESIALLNRRRKGVVTFVCEDQTLETFKVAVLDKVATTRPTSTVDLEIFAGFVKAATELSYVRDRTLVAQVGRLAKGGISFVIPREVFSTGMRGLFDPTKFELEIQPVAITEYESMLVRSIGPIIEAYCKRYTGPLSPEDLRDIANRMMSFRARPPESGS